MTTIFILNDTRSDRHHGCSIVMSNLLAAIERSGAQLLGTLNSGHYLEKNVALTIAFQKADRIIINGEGTLHHDRPYARYLLSLGNNAVVRGQKVYLINASWEANSPSLVKMLQGYAGIWVRDSGSAAELEADGIRATVVPDLTFQSTYRPVLHVEDTSVVVVTDSVFASTSELLFKLAGRHGWEYLPIIQVPSLRGQNADRAKWFKAIFYRVLTWLSFNQYHPRRYYQDLLYCRSETKSFLARWSMARTVVTGRYHAVCLALQHRLPFVCITSNTAKVERLLHDIGIDIKRHLLSVELLIDLPPERLLQHAGYQPDELAKLELFLTNSREKGRRMLEQVCGNE